MARPQSVDEDELLSRLASVFRDLGYEGASLSALSEGAGLQKASLYHRFPGGKQQMAEEVLGAALSWASDYVIAPLKSEGSPARRLAAVTRELDAFYFSGRKACLLNMLSAPRGKDGPFSAGIRSAFEALIDAFARLARDAGATPKVARRKAERAVMLMQGSLVLSRGLNSTEPFQSFLSALPQDLLGEA
ncbi:MAG TPA: TetR/AcrR family transcriptional regulator [Hyphomonadaceae bacterium]|jgi:AcrR family transcriptional regulator|nr:TetR/AcrR family transcriptional regulator [Hyphomonadaceae bacterium]